MSGWNGPDPNRKPPGWLGWFLVLVIIATVIYFATGKR